MSALGLPICFQRDKQVGGLQAGWSTLGYNWPATMDVASIRAFCLAFPNATEKLQWGDNLCFKVGGKIFVILGLDNPRLCFKCTPDTFAELIEREDVRPAPYVGRYQWVMLDRLDAVGDGELQELIRQSFEMVAAKAPKKKNILKRTALNKRARDERSRQKKRTRPNGPSKSF